MENNLKSYFDGATRQLNKQDRMHLVEDSYNEVYKTPYRVASRLRVSPKTVRKWIRTGRLGAVRLGRQYRIPATNLEQFIREQALEAEAE